MSFLKLSSVLTILIALASCMANPNIMDLSDIERQRTPKIRLYKDHNSPPASTYRVIEQVHGLSCWRNTENPKIVTEEEALDGLIIRAAQLDADAVVNIDCEHRAKTDWKNNCWESVSCFGDAIVFTDYEPAETTEALNVEVTRYSMILPKELNHQGSEPIITYDNNYPEGSYDFLGVVKIIECQHEDYYDLPIILGIPMLPPDADRFMGLPSHEEMKKKSVIESLRISAQKAGADAVVNLVCQPSTGPTFKSGCKSYIQCVGDMISFK